MSRLSLLLVLIPLCLYPIEGTGAPRGCVLRNGRLSCKIKGVRKRKRARNHTKKPAWPFRLIRRSRKTQSVGLPFRGMLHRPHRISQRGPGYFVVPRTIARGHVYGTIQLIDLIRRSARRVLKAYPKSRLTVGDLSARRGGKINGHRSHQNGRDVDLGFYLVDKRNRYRIASKWFVGMDPQAVGKAPNNHLVFDLERNWELVEALITDKAKVELILVADHIRTLLINYAEAVLRPARVIRRAKALLRHYPHHDDHFHIRIACPAGHRWCNR